MGRKHKYQRAIALSYEGTGVPEVSCKGFAASADEIVRIAKRHGVPVVEKAKVAQVLDHFDLDEQIPEQLFEVIAAILYELEAA